jgi:predicted transcriptional regulator
VPTVHARALRKAAEIFGERELATDLGVTQEQLVRWMQGLEPPPDSAFLRVVDILSESALRELRQQ